MDRYELVFDIIEHPGKYSTDKLNKIMSDPATREIYNLLCKTDSAVEAANEIDVDAEWKDFERKLFPHPRRSWMWLGSRAASIALIIGSSIAAVAAGIAVTVAVLDHKKEPIADNATKVTVTDENSHSEVLSEESDTAHVTTSTIMFENESLEVIMNMVAEAYGVEVRFNNKETVELCLFYRLNTNLPLDEIISQLNTFERITIVREGNTLIVD